MPILGPAPADYVVQFTDKNLVVLGDPLVNWTSLDVTLRFNEPDSSLLVVPADPWITEQFVPGGRIVIIRNGQVLTAGPIEQVKHERSDDGDNAGVGKFTVTAASDLALVHARAVYPNPAQTPDTQTLDNWTFTGNAETALRTLVNTQAGPGALAARRVAQLVLGSVAGVGSSVAVKATRMQMLGDVARLIAEVGGNLGIRTRQVGNQIVYEVFAPTDKSGIARFGFALGNMRYVSYEVSAPTATAAIVGGQGEGSDRFMIERINTGEQSTWGRFEKFVGRAGGAPAQSLQDDGDAALAEGAATTRLTTNVADSEDVRFGTHYGIGDIVSVESQPGQQVTDIVRTVHLQIYATAGEYVSATVGNQSALTDPAWVRRMREIDDRVGRLERTVVPAA